MDVTGSTSASAGLRIAAETVSENPAKTVDAAPLIWLGCITLLLFLPATGMTLADPDTYWHVATGRVMLDSQSILDRDIFSHTFAGTSWLPHEWLAEVLLAISYEIGGWPLVGLLAPIAGAATIVLLARHLSRDLVWQHVWIVCLLASTTLMAHFLSRPHVLAWPLTVLWTSELVRAADEERSPSWWLLPLLVVWTNLHGSYLFGLGLAALVATEVALRHSIRRPVIPWKWIAFIGAAILAGCLTPHGLTKYSHIINLMQQTVQLDTIIEWQSPGFHGFQPFELWLLGFILLTVALGIRLPLPRLAIVLLLIHMALKHQRFIDYVALLAPIFLAAPLARQLPRGSDGSERLNRVFSWLSGRAPISGICFLTFVGLVAFPLFKEIRPLSRFAPQAAINAIRSSEVKGPVFNDYNFGGYLISIGVPTFIDGRSDLFGDKFLGDYLSAVNLKEPDSLPSILEKYAITWTILSPERPAIALLDRLPGWHRLYADDVAVVHVKGPTTAQKYQ